MMMRSRDLYEEFTPRITPTATKQLEDGENYWETKGYSSGGFNVLLEGYRSQGNRWLTSQRTSVKDQYFGEHSQCLYVYREITILWFGDSGWGTCDPDPTADLP